MPQDPQNQRQSDSNFESLPKKSLLSGETANTQRLLTLQEADSLTKKSELKQAVTRKEKEIVGALEEEFPAYLKSHLPEDYLKKTPTPAKQDSLPSAQNNLATPAPLPQKQVAKSPASRSAAPASARTGFQNPSMRDLQTNMPKRVDKKGNARQARLAQKKRPGLTGKVTKAATKTALTKFLPLLATGAAGGGLLGLNYFLN